MTHCYLVSLFLHCPPSMGIKCPSKEAINRFIKGVQSNYIYWHAFPFNSQQENYNPSLFEFGLQMCQDLYNELNITTRPSSIVLSQRDVPGMTRGVIPYLLKHGIRAISVGVNGASAPPDVPDIFRWKSLDGTQEVLVIYHPDGYGGIKAKDCPIINNNITSYDHTLATFFRLDNHGPQFIEQVLKTMDQIGLEFKNAKDIFGSTFSDFVSGILNNNTVYNSLPVVDKEIGDTWSFGDQADPYKASITRIIQRKRAEYLNSININNVSNQFYNFSRLLVKCGEHTFGAHMGFLDPVKGEIIGVYTNKSSEYYAWSNVEFEAVKDSKHMTQLRDSWYEQRNLSYYWPLQALNMSNIPSERNLYNSINTEIKKITYPISPLDDVQFEWELQDKTNNYTFNVGLNKNFKVIFDDKYGSISSLIDTKHDNNAINYGNNIGLFLYQTFTEQEFNEYIGEYSIKPDRIWVYYNYGKVGLDIANNGSLKYQNINGYMLNLYRDKNDENIFCVEYRIGSNDSMYNELRQYYGAPQILYHIYNFSALISEGNNNKLSLQYVWINKQQTRIPEALWVVFEPGINCLKWRVNKFEQMMDIENVVGNGQMHIHGTMGNVSCEYNNNKYFNVESIDAGIAGFKPMNMNTFTPFPTPFTATNVKDGGVAFNLYNNIWGTNFVEYYPFDDINTNATYRFNVYF
eukprot:179630_1